MRFDDDHPLYILPFDHRHSYVKSMFGFESPLSTEQADTVRDSKRLIYEGMVKVLEGGADPARVGVLVDEEFGASILRDAHRRGAVTATSTEKSGQDEFDFEYGSDYAAHLDAFDPVFAKALVRYNPGGDAAMNARQTARLKQLSDECRRTKRAFMFELLVPATGQQLKEVAGDKAAYDRNVRPGLMDRAIRTLQDAGVEPDVWKIEGLDTTADCERIVDTARRDGRKQVACIVLGRGADEAAVRNWLSIAAGVPGFIGFAVGRTSFWDAVKDWRSGGKTRDEAVAQVASRYADWIATFEKGRAARS